MMIITLAGTLGKDAELRRTGGGDAVAGFSVAVDNGKDKNGNKRDATWVDCSLWGKRGEGLCQYLTKGTKVAITGRPTTREHNGKAYLGVSINEITLMGGGQKSDQQGGYAQQQSQQQGYGAGGTPNSNADLGDEIPFAAEFRA